MTKLALVTAATLTALTTQAAAEPKTFDGTWHIQLVTQSGFCDAQSSTDVTVRNGRVTANESGVRVAGQVGTDGTVSLALQKGPAQGAASGTLGSGGGSGTWTVSTVGCSGRWTAKRSNTTVAQAL